MLLARDLFTHGIIETTITKAKAVQPMVEKLITKARVGGEVKRRQILQVLADRKLTNTLMEEGKTRFAARTSGFTRIIKLGTRRGDSAERAVLQLIDERVAVEVVKPQNKVEKKVAEPKAKRAPAKRTKKETV